MAADPYKYFRIEARELLEQLAQGALDIEKHGPAEATLARVLRVAHTLKGAARVVKQTAIAEHAHALEDMFAALRDSSQPPSDDQTGRILDLLDQIGARVSALSPGDVPDFSARPAERLEPVHGIRPDAADLESLVDGVAEAQTRLEVMRPRVERADRVHHYIELIDGQLSGLRAREAASGADRRAIEKTLALVDDLRRDYSALHRGLGTDLDQLDRAIREVGVRAARLHLVAAGAMFQFLERATRDAAKAVGKRVAFASHGGDIRVDGSSLTIVQGALLQVVRNAVAHGIERHEHERAAAGKPGEGVVTLTASRQGMWLTFTCADDGRGVDVNAVRHILQRKGVSPVPSDTASLLSILLKGGLSTSGTVTEMSGRGVGLDVVRAAAERLGGQAAMTTDPGKGTAVALTIPSSSASFPALLLEAVDVAAAIPLDAVRCTVRVAPSDVIEAGTVHSIVVDGRSMPLVSLHAVMHPSAGQRLPAATASAVVVESGGRQAALTFDSVRVGVVLMRPLPAMAPAVPVVAGVALDAGGEPRLVLDPATLVPEAHRHDRPQAQPAAAGPAILVVDDSLTTRLLEQSILEAAGYEVTLASSGEEGIEKAHAGAYSLALVDVEMPGMDGFEFIERLRADSRLRQTPAILVTSRSSPEDRQRGRDVGAQGYIVKSDFDQAVFLQQIRALLP